MFRPLGAAIFGLAADRYGRRMPFMINNALLIVFELATGFCQTYRQFLAVRALFGFAMGGMYGNAAATALEDIPAPARGLMSGIYQSGYPIGYLLAVVFWRAFDEKSRYGWRVLFWFGAAPPIFLIVARWYMGESHSRRSLRETKPGTGEVVEDLLYAWRKHWKRLAYLSILMAGFSYMVRDLSSLCPNHN
jgi:SHS family lactate transporter-like MFS transporter